MDKSIYFEEHLRLGKKGKQWRRSMWVGSFFEHSPLVVVNFS
jgi:hypothetical protein